MEDETENTGDESAKGEPIGEIVAKLEVFREAGSRFLKDTPELRPREKGRKRGFVQHQDPNWAVRVRKSANTEPMRNTGFDEVDRRRTGYFRASQEKDPGPLSKFGDGDGSFFDSFLTNHRFASPGGTALSFEHIGGSPLARPPHTVPHIGLKQWIMPAAELRGLEEQRVRRLRGRAADAGSWRRQTAQSGAVGSSRASTPGDTRMPDAPACPGTI